MSELLDILAESLDDIYLKYYQNSATSHLDRDEFDDTIRIDPTFKPEKDALGRYGKWLLQLRNVQNHPFSNDDSQELTDQLKIFDAHKNGYDVADRDIGKISSLEQLLELNHKYDAEHVSIQSIKASSFPGLELLGQSANWEVYRPTTYAASKHIRGNNASWCTGRSNTCSFFDSYNSHSILLVFINKANRDEKYQAAVNKQTFKVTEFRDADNRSVDFIAFYEKNNDLSAIFKKSKYSDIYNELERQVVREKERIRGLKKLFSNIVDDALIIDDDSLSILFNDDYDIRNSDVYDFIPKTVTAIKIKTLKKTIRAVMDKLFSGQSMRTWLSSGLTVYLPENISDISTDIESLSGASHIGISKKSRFTCYKWQKDEIRNRIVWY